MVLLQGRCRWFGRPDTTRHGHVRKRTQFGARDHAAATYASDAETRGPPHGSHPLRRWREARARAAGTQARRRGRARREPRREGQSPSRRRGRPDQSRRPRSVRRGAPRRLRRTPLRRVLHALRVVRADRVGARRALRAPRHAALLRAVRARQDRDARDVRGGVHPAAALRPDRDRRRHAHRRRDARLPVRAQAHRRRALAPHQPRRATGGALIRSRARA